MALKALMLKRQIELAQKSLAALREKDAEFVKRESDLEASIAEVQTDEERAAVDEAVTAFETEKAEHTDAVGKLEEEIRGLETELSEIEAKQEIDTETEVGRMVTRGMGFIESGQNVVLGKEA